ncbi:MAG: thiamine phosphate synthase [Thiotrichales bacterium]|nr:MAG: thiamine phosphate synthase [Thiotrichales bacterium]
MRGLYAITDEKLIPPSAFAATVELALKGGAAIVQYRDKSGDATRRLQQASELRELCTQYSATLIINDDIALAQAVSADGVHLGEDDDTIAQARDLLGDESIIGISCYNDLQRAIDARSAGADYVAFGAMFSSATKPNARSASYELIRTAKTQLDIPICAIGGIDGHNVAGVIVSGADMTALIHGLFAADDIMQTAAHITGLFD